MEAVLTSPIVLVAVGLAVLSVAMVLLVVWLVTLDRRMRGVVDSLEAERRKVAEMQAVMGRRGGAGRGYGAPRAQRQRPVQPQPSQGRQQPQPGRQQPQQSRPMPGQPSQGRQHSVPQPGRQQPASQPGQPQARPAGGSRAQGAGANATVRSQPVQSHSQPVQSAAQPQPARQSQQHRDRRVPRRGQEPLVSQGGVAKAACVGADAANEALRAKSQGAAAGSAVSAVAGASASSSVAAAARAVTPEEEARRAAEREARRKRMEARRQAAAAAQGGGMPSPGSVQGSSAAPRARSASAAVSSPAQERLAADSRDSAVRGRHAR